MRNKFFRIPFKFIGSQLLSCAEFLISTQFDTAYFQYFLYEWIKYQAEYYHHEQLLKNHQCLQFSPLIYSDNN